MSGVMRRRILTDVIPLTKVGVGQVWVLTKKGKIVKVIGKSLCVWVWVWVCVCVCVCVCVFALYI